MTKDQKIKDLEERLAESEFSRKAAQARVVKIAEENEDLLRERKRLEGEVQWLKSLVQQLIDIAKKIVSVI